MNKKLRIVFLGTPDFAVASLKALIDNKQNIVGVITAPDKPAGRGKQIQESAVKKYAQKNNLTILQPLNLKDEDFLTELRNLKADLQIVVAFRMLPVKVWDMPRLGTFNLHASMLPQYRGAAPINWAIMNGETSTGVSTFFLQHKIDTGNIILQTSTPISPNTNAGELHDTLMNLGAKLVIETVLQIEENNVTEKPQKNLPNSELKLAPKIYKSDCKIDWYKPLNEIHNKIRGLSPYPTAWTIINNKSLKIFKGETELVKHTNTIASIITDNKSFLKIAVQDGYYQITELQIEGKKRMNIQNFLQGFQNTKLSNTIG
jgi:methionyl-tRNA formyltransferase